MMRCTICYHLYNFRKAKNTHGRVFTLVKSATLPKVTLLHVCFSRLLNSTNGTKSRKASQLQIENNPNLDDLDVVVKDCNKFCLHVMGSPLNKYANLLSANPTKWSNKLKEFVGNSRQIECVWPFCGVGA